MHHGILHGNINVAFDRIEDKHTKAEQLRRRIHDFAGDDLRILRALVDLAHDLRRAYDDASATREKVVV